MDDNMIVEMYLARNEDASLYTQLKYGTRLRGIAAAILSNAQDADEAVNDTLLAAWNAIPPNRPHEYFFPFLARITRCKAIDHERRHRRSSGMFAELTDELAACIPDEDGDALPEDAVLATELGALIDAFLATVKKEARIIFVRRYFYSESIAQIADLLDCKESRVKVSLMRSRDKLRDFLRTQMYTDL